MQFFYLETNFNLVYELTSVFFSFLCVLTFIAQLSLSVSEVMHGQ